LLLILINEVLCLEEESKDKYYLITFQFNNENDEEIDDPKESNNELTFINNQMKNILELMIDNKDTFENEELLNEYSDIKEKRDGNGDSLEEIVKLINENSSSLINIIYENKERGIYTIHALLSNELYLIIKNMPYVIECIEDVKIEDTDPIVQINDSPTDNIEDDEEAIDSTITNYYSLSSIKDETKWDDILIEKNAYNHLSLLSQGKFDNSLINEYDSNYYYPSSAGKGVNIVVIDSGFMFDHKDFNNNNRIVRCQAICVDNGCVDTYNDPILSKFCTIDSNKHLYPKHGTKVASTAAGNIYGVAKKANIFGIAVDMATASFVSAIKYIMDFSSTLFPPDKTIINISSGSYSRYAVYDNILKDAEKKGYMIITSGGNDNIDGCIKTKREYIRNNEKKIAKDFHYPSGYESAIGVGSINNNYSSLSLNVNYSILYSKASFSNYGDCIDLWAPGYVYAALPSENEIEILEKPNYCKTLKNKRDYEINEKERIIKKLCTDNNNMFRKIKVTSSSKKWGAGTSFSSPIVAGISALFISEFPDVKFNQNILRKLLDAVSLKDIINFNNISKHSRNIFINNGKRIIYSKDNRYPKNHCGPNVGNSICPNNACCSKDGLCGTSDSFCEIRNGCQFEFGNCNNKNIRTQSQNTTTNLKTTQKAIVKSTTTILKTTAKAIVKSTTTILKTPAKATVEPTLTKNNTNTTTVIEKDIPISTNGKCGPTYGRCKENWCCSQYGYCGQTKNYCDSGCQKDYGRCNNVILDIPLTTEKANSTTKKSNITIKTSITTNKTTQKAVVKPTTTALKTTQKAVVKPTTTKKTTQKAVVKPTTTKKATPTLPPLISIITMYNTKYYVGMENTKIPYDLRISKTKTNLYSNIKKAKVWAEIKNSSGYCLGNINKNYINKYKIKESSVKKDYLVFMPCNDSNVLSFYQYAIKTGDTIVKIGYRSNNKPFKGIYESNNHYKCRGKEGDNCCMYLDNDSIVAGRCDGYYDSTDERKFYSFKVM
jgi:subtilisin family serine protease